MDALTVRLEGEQVLCRFHLSNYVQVQHQPLYERIVEMAHHAHMAGATVLKGMMGFFLGGRLLNPGVWSLSQELPMVVEVVDAQARIGRLLDAVAPIFHHGIITLERAHVLYYRTVKPATPDFSDEGEALKGGAAMQLPEEGDLLRVFLGDADTDAKSGKPVYEMLVRRAREMGMAGATVLRGSMGFGKHSHLHSSKLLELSTDLPVVVEIVDSEERIQSFMPIVDEAVQEGLVTIEKVRILKYEAKTPPPSPIDRPQF